MEYVTTKEPFWCFPQFPTVMIPEAKLTIGMSLVPLLIGGARSIAPIITQTEQTLCIPTIVYQSLIAGISWYAGFNDICIQKKVSFETKYSGQGPNSKLLHMREDDNLCAFTATLAVHALFLLYNANCFWEKTLFYVAPHLLLNLSSFVFVCTAFKRLNGKIPLNHLD